MFRLFGFLSALLFIAGGFALAVVDGTASIGADHLSLTPLNALLNGTSLKIGEQIQRVSVEVSPFLRERLILPLLSAPAFLVLWFAGFSLYILSRRSRKPIGISNRDR